MKWNPNFMLIKKLFREKPWSSLVPKALILIRFACCCKSDVDHPTLPHFYLFCLFFWRQKTPIIKQNPIIVWTFLRTKAKWTYLANFCLQSLALNGFSPSIGVQLTIFVGEPRKNLELRDWIWKRMNKSSFFVFPFGTFPVQHQMRVLWQHRAFATICFLVYYWTVIIVFLTTTPLFTYLMSYSASLSI